MSDNPLVEPPKDSTEWYTGVGIAEAVSDVVTGIRRGDWIDIGFGAVGATLEALSATMDPLGTLFSWSISWLIEHVKPLTDALDWLAGDADEVAAQAATWRNVAESLRGTAEALETDVRHDTTGWSGKAADAYRARMATTAQLVHAQSQAAEGVGTATELCGTLVGTVREAVRDFVADCVGRLAAWAIEVLASKGYALPVVIEQASLRVARWGVRIIEMLTKLVRTLGNLVPQVNKLGELIGKIGELLDEMAAGKPLPRPPEPPKPPDPPRPPGKPGDPGEPPEPGNPDDPPDEPPDDPPDDDVGPADDPEERRRLIEEVRAEGHKIDPDQVVEIGRDPNGRIVWLEEGSSGAGLEHIENKHLDDFADKGVESHEIGSVVHRAAAEGDYTGYRLGGGKNPRPIFTVQHNGETLRVAISIGSNGFVVSGQPVGDEVFSRAKPDPRYQIDPNHRGW